MNPLLLASVLASALALAGCKIPGTAQAAVPAPAPAPPASPEPPAVVLADTQPLGPPAGAVVTPLHPMVGPAAHANGGGGIPGPAPTLAPPMSGPPMHLPPPPPGPMPSIALSPATGQYELCEVSSWRQAIDRCQEGNLVTVLPERGGDAFQLMTSAAICDFSQQILSRHGGVVCIFTRKRFDLTMERQAKQAHEARAEDVEKAEQRKARKAAEKARKAAEREAAAAPAVVDAPGQ